MSITNFDYLITKESEMTKTWYEAKINSRETSEENSQQRKKFAVEKDLSLKERRIERFIDYFEMTWSKDATEDDLDRRDKHKIDYNFQF